MCPTESRRSQRGVALAMVLAMLVVMFIIGVTVGGLSTNNARMAMVAQDKARARQAAWAGQAAAQAVLNSQTFSTSSERESLEAAPIPTAEVALRDPFGDPRACAWYQVEHVPDTETAPAPRITLRSTGFLKNDDGSRRAATVVTVRYHRAEGAFRHAVQATGAVTLEGTAAVSADDDVAIRTNAPTVERLGSGTTVNGDILVGTSGATSAVAGVSLGDSSVAAAPASAALQPVVAPTLEVHTNASQGAVGGYCKDFDAIWEIDASWEYVTISFGGTEYKLKGRVAELGVSAFLGLPVSFVDTNGERFTYNPTPESRRRATNLTHPDPCPMIGEWRRSTAGVNALGQVSSSSPDSSEASVGTGPGNSLTLFPGSYTSSRDSRLAGARILTLARRSDSSPFRPAMFVFDSLTLKNCVLRLPPGQTAIYVTNSLDLKSVTVLTSGDAAADDASGSTPLSAQNPCNLLILGTSECRQVTLTGCSLAAALYAPQAGVTLAGTSLRGSVVGDTVRCSATTAVTYDPRLKVLSYEGVGGLNARWVQEQ